MDAIAGTGVWSGELRYGEPGPVADAAAELEELGYSALWVPDIGGELFAAVEVLLAATSGIAVATGILNLWMHSPEESAAARARLTAAHGDRFLMGIGVSHAPLVDHGEPGRYRKPLSAMAAFLDGLDAAPEPVARRDRVLAALGPKMLDLARDRSGGVHPYNVTPEHTEAARRAVGPDAMVLPEQAVALTTDAAEARRMGRRFLEHYLVLPNYANNLLRLGFDEGDLSGGGSDRLIDSVVAWGDVDTIAARVQEHRDAGADHVAIQAVSDESPFPMATWRELAPALTAR